MDTHTMSLTLSKDTHEASITSGPSDTPSESRHGSVAQTGARPRFWELLLAAILLLTVAPFTLVSIPLMAATVPVMFAFGLSESYGRPFSAYSTAYVAGYAVTSWLVIRYIVARLRESRLRGNASAPSLPSVIASHRFSDAICAFGALYLLDFFMSPAGLFDSRFLYWPFLVFSAFLLIVLGCRNREQGYRILALVAVCTAVEAAHAILMFLLGIRPFVTPGFGNRAQGTFDNPAILCAVCLVGAPLCLGLASGTETIGLRRWYTAGALVNIAALLLTHLRAGWLALAVVLTMFLISPGERKLLFLTGPEAFLKDTRRTSRHLVVLGVLIGLLVGGALLVRTHGRPMGNSDDRPFWGRLAVYDVALRVIAERPLTGHGLSSYSAVQARAMTPRLQEFNPHNSEAKSFFLNLAAEFGAVGGALFALVAWCYWRMIKLSKAAFEDDQRIRTLLAGAHGAVVGVLVMGLVDTPVLQFHRLAPTLALFVMLASTCVMVRGTALPTLPALPTGQPTDKSNQSPSIHGRRRRGARWASVIVSTLIAFTAFVYVVAQLVPARRAVLPYAGFGRPVGYPAEYREYTPLNRIAPAIRDATVAMEDARFYRHRGFDGDALLRALQVNLRKGQVKQGGSTITQQLAKNLFLTNERTFARKHDEMFLAFEMEVHLGKNRILELYLNTIEYGMECRGISEAARFYFDTTPDQLTLAQSALLVGMVPSPPREYLKIERLESVKEKALDRIALRWRGRYAPAQIEEARRTAVSELLSPTARAHIRSH